MKLNLLRLFQVLCPILFISFGYQITSNLSITNSFKTSKHYTSSVKSNHGLSAKSIHLVNSTKEECYVEDSNEDEAEFYPEKKAIPFYNDFIAVFGVSLPVIVKHNHISKVAFATHLPVCSSTKSNTLYQVFRI